MSKVYTIPVLKPGFPKIVGELRVAQTNLYFPHVGDKLVGEQVYAFSIKLTRQEGEDIEIFF